MDAAAAMRRVHAAALGYQPMRMKPVHFATSFLLAVTGRHSTLELLNKASVPKAAPKSRVGEIDEYVAEALLPRLRSEGRMGPGVSEPAFKALRAHLNAAFNNDGAALGPAFAPYRPFGSDYSSPSTAYLTDMSKNHGFSGSFVARVFSATPAGRELLDGVRSVLSLPAPPMEALGAPLLDATEQDWADPYDERFGSLDADRAAALGELMEDQTRALSRLVSNLMQARSSYALRYMVLGLASWLFSYMMRRGGGRPLLLLDCLEGRNRRVRAQSRASYSRQLDAFARSYDVSHAAGGLTVDEDDWLVFSRSGEARQSLEDHFRDLGVRIGFIQPRAPGARRKHCELQGDTLKVLALTVLGEGEILTVIEFSRRLRETWGVLAGADPEDGELLREGGFWPLDADDDLEPNGAAFRRLLVRLGLAVEPSDGLTLCALDAEELIG